MALRFHAPSRLVDAMETDISPRASNALKDKVFHANIQIQSIEDASVPDDNGTEDPRLIQDDSSASEDIAYRQRAAEMQMYVTLRRKMKSVPVVQSSKQHSFQSKTNKQGHQSERMLLTFYTDFRWWDEAIVKNMDLPDGYVKVAVLLCKWDDELDELKTGAEV
jgi:phosphatidate phosphatase APP1